MNKLNENLSEILNVDPIERKQEVLPAQPREIEPSQGNSEARNDFDLARDTIRNMMGRAEDVLEELIIVAKESESPRAYEVASNLIKTVTEAAKDMMELHKRMKDIEAPVDGGSSEPDIKVNKAVFVGSTADLQKMIRERKMNSEGNEDAK